MTVVSGRLVTLGTEMSTSREAPAVLALPPSADHAITGPAVLERRHWLAALAMLFGWAMGVPSFARVLVSLRGRT